jgi:hypothetical protein
VAPNLAGPSGMSWQLAIDLIGPNLAALAASLVGVVQVEIGNTAVLKNQGCSHVGGHLHLLQCMLYKFAMMIGKKKAMLSKIYKGRFTYEVCSIFCYLYLLIILLHRRLHNWLHLHVLTAAVHWLHLFPAGPITRIVRLGVPRCKYHTNRLLDMITVLYVV